MKVLIACEFSGVVRDAFLRRGHEAMSCDFLPTTSPGPHYQGDVRNVLYYGWDLMIAHPDCTHLSVSGAAWFKDKRMKGLQQMAVSFVRELSQVPIPKICIENRSVSLVLYGESRIRSYSRICLATRRRKQRAYG